MGKFFRIAGGILTIGSLIGLIVLMFGIGIDLRKLDMVATYGAVEMVLVTGLILQVLYKVTEMEL